MREHTPGPWLIAPDDYLANFVYAINGDGFNRFHLAITRGNISKSEITSKKEIEANTLFVSRYKNNKLMRDSKIRGLIDSYLNFKGTAPGKSIPHIHEEFDYVQALVTKYGYDKVRRVVDKTIKDEYWGKSFDSFGFFNKKVQGETLFEKIYKSITGE